MLDVLSVGIVTLGVAVFMHLPSLVPPISAHSSDSYGWTACHWAYREDYTNANMTLREDGSFPVDGFGDGVRNSFDDRVSTAVSTWSSAMAGIGLRGRLIRNASTSYANIVVRYSEIDSQNSGLLGVTSIDGRSGSELSQHCPIHGLADNRNFNAEILIDKRPDWFTQDWDRRAYWEGCAARNYVTAYTCSKTADFTGALTHEVGHAYGLRHPQSVDCHIDPIRTPCNNNQVANLADCGPSNFDQATMCASRIPYRAEAWTLHSWDIESLRRQYANH